MAKRQRRWRWVTRDKNTCSDSDVCIWPGVKRPHFLPDSVDRCGRPEIDWWQYPSPSKIFRGHSIDIYHSEFRRMTGVSMKRGVIYRMVFSVTMGTSAPW